MAKSERKNKKEEQKCRTLPTQLAWYMVDMHSYLLALSTTSINLKSLIGWRELIQCKYTCKIALTCA